MQVIEGVVSGLQVEIQSDYLGLEYMYKTCYDPQAFISFFEKVQAKEKKKPGTLSKAFETHPQTPDRIEKSQKEISTILPPRKEYIVDTSEFQHVKARLAALENHRRLNKGDEQRPTLRRAQRPSDKDDGRPTLKRREDQISG